MTESEKLIKQLEKLETLFNTAMGKVNERDETIKKKDQRIAELTDKLLALTTEKDDALKSKIELMQNFSKQSETIQEQLLKLQKAVIEKDSQIETLRASKKKAQDSVMGSSFEQDRLQKEIQDREQKLKEIEAKVAIVASGSTGIFLDMKSVVDYLKSRMKAANRTLRLVVPNLKFMEENGILESLDGLAESCVVNIATSLDVVTQGALIEKFKKRRYYLTDYREENLICISANGADIAVSFVKGDNVSGFYTDIVDMVQILSPSAMHAFVKGKKI